MSSLDLLLFLGAGASMPPPTLAPAFEPLTRLVLENLAWRRPDRDAPSRWSHDGFPEINPPWESGLPPEVVFRVLDGLRLDFATPVERLMASVVPNAAHHVAARLLAAGGCVWTPNIDTAIERAWSMLPGIPDLHRSLGPLIDVPGEGYAERDFSSVVAGTLVKFHGSADVPGSLAFTDRQLLTPLPASQVTHLAELAAGRHLAFYGYRGADPDLHDLLRESMRRAAAVTCFVVDRAQKRTIETAFPGLPIRFLPEDPREELKMNLGPCAAAFLELAHDCGLTGRIDAAVTRCLGDDPWQHGGPRAPDFDFTGAPALVNAQLVERFGDPRDHQTAFRSARRADFTKPTFAIIRAAPDYARWMVRWSLYHDGVVAKVIRSSIDPLSSQRVRPIARLPLAKQYRDLVLNKAPALLLADGLWPELLSLTEYAMSVRRAASGEPRPDDLYYHGHALRYAGEISRARMAQEQAAERLAGERWRRADPERLAGTILEQGILDLYEGRFTDACRRAADLKDNRGRFAIQRWLSWGHWLEGTARIYLLELDRAGEELRTAAERFSVEDASKYSYDVLSSQLLAARVARALGVTFDQPREPDWEGLSPRQRDDLRLLKADIAIGERDPSGASALVQPIVEQPSNVMALLWARLVMAEVGRATSGTADGFEQLRQEARSRGIPWPELQATAGLIRAGQHDAEDDWRELTAGMQLPEDLTLVEALQLGDVPVLWALA